MTAHDLPAREWSDAEVDAAALAACIEWGCGPVAIITPLDRAIFRAGLAAAAPARECIKPTHEAADAFWTYWRENGETHRHGYYESTWGAINAALRTSGGVMHYPPKPPQCPDCGQYITAPGHECAGLAAAPAAQDPPP